VFAHFAKRGIHSSLNRSPVFFLREVDQSLLQNILAEDSHRCLRLFEDLSDYVVNLHAFPAHGEVDCGQFIVIGGDSGGS